MVDVQNASYVTGDKLHSFTHYKYTSFFDEEDGGIDCSNDNERWSTPSPHHSSYEEARGSRKKVKRGSGHCVSGHVAYESPTASANQSIGMESSTTNESQSLEEEESLETMMSGAAPDFDRPYDPSEDVCGNEEISEDLVEQFQVAQVESSQNIFYETSIESNSQLECSTSAHEDSEPYAAQMEVCDFSFVSKVYSTGNKICSLILQICTQSNENAANSIYLKAEDRGRLKFLKDTLELILAYMSDQVDIVKSIRAFQDILQISLFRMDDVLDMLNKISDGRSILTANFDIFELKLRTALEQFHSMFPLSSAKPRDSPYSGGRQQSGPDQVTASENSMDVISSPSLVIQDEYARAAWVAEFGEKCFHVDFDDFLRMVKHRLLNDDSGISSFETFVLYLKYFLNYPRDEFVTTYKFDLFIRLFGPAASVAANFNKLVAGQGFLGLINRIQAYEILTMTSTKRCLLIRFSRTEPQFLAFSYKTSEGKIAHQINLDRKTGKPIPVEKFIKTRFPKYQIVNKKVNVHAILGYEVPQSLCDYASLPSGYVI